MVIVFFLELSVTPLPAVELPACVLVRRVLAPLVLLRTLLSTRFRVLDAAPSVSSTVFTTSFTGSGIACLQVLRLYSSTYSEILAQEPVWHPLSSIKLITEIIV